MAASLGDVHVVEASIGGEGRNKIKNKMASLGC